MRADFEGMAHQIIEEMRQKNLPVFGFAFSRDHGEHPGDPDRSPYDVYFHEK